MTGKITSKKGHPKEALNVVLKSISKFEEATKEAIKDLRDHGFSDEVIVPTLILKLKQIAQSEGIKKWVN